MTGTVAANTSQTSRSSTITLTASGNLSTTSPYSFVVSQSGAAPSVYGADVTLVHSDTSFDECKCTITMSGYQSGSFELRTDETSQKAWNIPIGQTLTLRYSNPQLIRGGASYVGLMAYDTTGYPGAISDTISSEKYIYLTVRS